jgi:hypothetical protein
MPEVDCAIEQLTYDAIEAAKKGQWDQVIVLYDQRLAQGPQPSLSSEAIQSLMESDQWLIKRIREAQAAIKQHLLDIQDQHRKFAVLKKQWGNSSTTQVRHLLTI